ncbi:hypothetical protein [Sphingomonas sp. EC-HK361]|uniref:hypothetical protein n=1 Tax=Sphingomonas sp. EC-HK361 TaxID=2038397 RepID=UPI00125F663D|nr:hypothetical protein [Sphingomonas sp. EC-HK361]
MNELLRFLKAFRRQSFHLAALISLLAFVANALILQAHRHLEHRGVGATHHVATNAAPLVLVQGADEPCPLCEALSFDEPYVQPTAVAFSVRLTPSFSASLQFTKSLLLAARAHDWQSRAPPVSG